MRSFCSCLSNKKSWKPHSGVGTKGPQKKESFHSTLHPPKRIPRELAPSLRSPLCSKLAFLVPPERLCWKLPKTSQIYSYCLWPQNCSSPVFSCSANHPTVYPSYSILTLGISSYATSNSVISRFCPCCSVNKFHTFLLLRRHRVSALVDH